LARASVRGDPAQHWWRPHVSNRNQVVLAPQRLYDVTFNVKSCLPATIIPVADTGGVWMFDRYYDELKVGDKRDFSGITVTETHVVNFAGVTGDHFGLHMDAEYAKTTPFKNRVAHGLLVLSCGAGLIPMLPGRVLAFLGMDEVRFIAPVFFGDTVHPVMEVLSKKDKSPGGVVTIQELILNQLDEVVISAKISVWVGSSPEDA
jgi:3-hydroxybutyryl-CoA dehydratase